MFDFRFLRCTSRDVSPQAGWAFHFFLDEKTKQKNQAKIKLFIFSYVAFRFRATQFLRVL
jgi:hypothetical protein